MSFCFFLFAFQLVVNDSCLILTILLLIWQFHCFTTFCNFRAEIFEFRIKFIIHVPLVSKKSHWKYLKRELQCKTIRAQSASWDSQHALEECKSDELSRNMCAINESIKANMRSILIKINNSTSRHETWIIVINQVALFQILLCEWKRPVSFFIWLSWRTI